MRRTTTNLGFVHSVTNRVRTRRRVPRWHRAPRAAIAVLPGRGRRRGLGRLPDTTPKEFARTLRKAGFIDVSQKGSHLLLRHPDGRRATVPMHRRSLKPHVLRLKLKQAGMSEEAFRRLV